MDRLSVNDKYIQPAITCEVCGETCYIDDIDCNDDTDEIGHTRCVRPGAD